MIYSSFPIKMIDLIKCQKEGGDLLIDDSSIVDDRIADGSLRCVICGAKYYIKDGILDLKSLQKRIDKISFQEVIARDKEAEIYDTIIGDISNNIEIASVLAHLEKISGKNIAEFGCGTGRFTIELLKDSNQIIALDYSIKSLLVLARKIGNKSNIGLVLADATQVQLARGGFDLTLSCQVLEHIPAEIQRNRFLSRVHEILSRRGIFICTAYHQDLRRRFKKLPVEGFHSSNIFYHNFNTREIKGEMASYFKKLHIHPINIFAPFVRKICLSSSFLVRLSRMSEHLPVLNKFGSLILIRAQKA